MSIIHLFKNMTLILFFFQMTVFLRSCYLIKDSIIFEHILSSFRFVTRNFPIYEVVAFIHDDDSMFTSQFFRLKSKSLCQIASPIQPSYQKMPDFFSTHLHAYPKTSYLKSKKLFKGKKLKQYNITSLTKEETGKLR
ncbi:hypothetical protein ACB098_09G167100 [Castanea mollissima]